MKPLTSYTCKLTDAQSKALSAWLRGQDYEFREVPYAAFAASKGDVNLVYYMSGKLVVQGKGTHEFVEFVVVRPDELGTASVKRIGRPPFASAVYQELGTKLIVRPVG